MTESERLQLEAMALCDEALAARIQGDTPRTDEFFRLAYERERDAAALLAPVTELEPTRSIIHRSAAALALQCGDVASALRIATTALGGDPPSEIREELLEIIADGKTRLRSVTVIRPRPSGRSQAPEAS